MSTWSQAPRGAHLFWIPIPAHAIVPFVISLFIQTWWMLSISLITVFVLVYLKAKGRTVLWVIRRFNSRIRDERVYARTVFYRRRVLHSLDFDHFAD
jgi:hypothetical protein